MSGFGYRMLPGPSASRSLPRGMGAAAAGMGAVGRALGGLLGRQARPRAAGGGARPGALLSKEALADVPGGEVRGEEDVLLVRALPDFGALALPP